MKGVLKTWPATPVEASLTQAWKGCPELVGVALYRKGSSRGRPAIPLPIADCRFTEAGDNKQLTIGNRNLEITYVVRRNQTIAFTVR